MKTQLWIAVSVYVLVAIVKKRLQLSATLHTLSLTVFENAPLQKALAERELSAEMPMNHNQLNLFEI